MDPVGQNQPESSDPLYLLVRGVPPLRKPAVQSPTRSLQPLAMDLRFLDCGRVLVSILRLGCHSLLNHI